MHVHIIFIVVINSVSLLAICTIAMLRFVNSCTHTTGLQAMAEFCKVYLGTCFLCYNDASLSTSSQQCATLSPQLPVVDTQKLSCYKRLDLGVTTVASVVSLPFEDLVPSCPPKPTLAQQVLNSPTSKQDEARDSGYQDLGDTGSSEVTEQVIALETGSKQNKERQRIPEKVNNCSSISVKSMFIL